MNVTQLELSRRRLLQLGAAGGVTAFLSSCGSSADSSSKSIQYWSSFNDKQAQEWIEKNWIDAYNSTDPEFPVKLTVKQLDTMVQQVQTALAAGSGPDIIKTAGPSAVSTYKDAGNITPLDDFAEEFGWSERFLPWALETGKIDGKLYSVPESYETLNALYNTTTFEKNNWTMPTSRAEFEALCEEAAGMGMIPIANGNADYQGVSDWFGSIMLNHYCGPDAIRQALTGEIDFTEAVFVDGMTLFDSYFQKGWVGGSVDRYFTNTFADMYSAVATGEGVFHYTGTWAFIDAPEYFGEAAGNDGVWDWAAYPSFRDGNPAEIWELSIGGTQSINADATSIEGTAAFLDYFNSDPAKQGRGLAEAGISPAAITIQQSDFPSSMDERVSRLYDTMGSAETVGYTTWTFFPATADVFISEGWDKVVAGDMKPAEWCAELSDIYKTAVADGFVAPLPTGT